MFAVRLDCLPRSEIMDVGSAAETIVVYEVGAVCVVYAAEHAHHVRASVLKQQCIASFLAEYFGFSMLTDVFARFIVVSDIANFPSLFVSFSSLYKNITVI